VEEDLRQRLARHEWALEEQIPGISALMEHYDASLGTIRRAQDPLVTEGLLRREQGRGVFVAAYPDPVPAKITARELIREAISLLARASSLLEQEDRLQRGRRLPVSQLHAIRSTALRRGYEAIRSWPWWPADSSVYAVGARVARVEWWRGYRGCTA
jgi:DNA-binding transcriptional regulator YhcF (GntR family)